MFSSLSWDFLSICLSDESSWIHPNLGLRLHYSGWNSVFLGNWSRKNCWAIPSEGPVGYFTWNFFPLHDSLLTQKPFQILSFFFFFFCKGFCFPITTDTLCFHSNYHILPVLYHFLSFCTFEVMNFQRRFINYSYLQVLCTVLAILNNYWMNSLVINMLLTSVLARL